MPVVVAGFDEGGKRQGQGAHRRHGLFVPRRSRRDDGRVPAAPHGPDQGHALADARFESLLAHVVYGGAIALGSRDHRPSPEPGVDQELYRHREIRHVQMDDGPVHRAVSAAWQCSPWATISAVIVSALWGAWPPAWLLKKISPRAARSAMAGMRSAVHSRNSASL